jgi:proteasome assembly chaperone (PAC2) family protein
MTMETLMEPIRADRAVLSFKGWPDAGEMVQHSLQELSNLLSWTPAAVWDLDGFWQLESVRPQVHIRHGQIQRMEWPSYNFQVSEPIGGQCLLLGVGPEPTCNWRRFAEMLVEQLRNWQCREIILLGSLYDQIFHDEVVISAVVQDSKSYSRVRELGCRLVQYQGPGAIHAAIMEAAAKVGMQGMSLWAHLPFYLKGPSELLMSHYLRVLGKLLGLPMNTNHLLEVWKGRQTEIEGLIEQDRELRQLLEQLKDCEGGGRALSGSSAKVVHLDEFLKRRQDVDLDEPA